MLLNYVLCCFLFVCFRMFVCVCVCFCVVLCVVWGWKGGGGEGGGLCYLCACVDLPMYRPPMPFSVMSVLPTLCTLIIPRLCVPVLN